MKTTWPPNPKSISYWALYRKSLPTLGLGLPFNKLSMSGLCQALGSSLGTLMNEAPPLSL